MGKKADQQLPHHYDRWEILRRFPWKDLTLGLIIPRLIFAIARSHTLIIPGAFLSISWCLGLLTINYLRARKINLFAIFALIMVLVQTEGSLIRNDPSAHLVLKASGYILLGIIFFCSLLWSRSFIEIFVDKAGATFPEHIKTSPYYAKAWRKLTFIWGFLCLIGAAILIFLKLNNPDAAIKFDTIIGWPAITLLFIFSAEFPRWYWKKYLHFPN